MPFPITRPPFALGGALKPRFCGLGVVVLAHPRWRHASASVRARLFRAHDHRGLAGFAAASQTLPIPVPRAPPRPDTLRPPALKSPSGRLTVAQGGALAQPWDTVPHFKSPSGRLNLPPDAATIPRT